MRQFNWFRASTLAICGVLASTLVVAGCEHEHERDHDHYDRGRTQVYYPAQQPDERVVIRDDHGWDHHGFYDARGDWHGGYYDEKHDFHNDPADWGRGRERFAQREGPADQYDRYGQDKTYDRERR